METDNNDVNTEADIEAPTRRHALPWIILVLITLLIVGVAFAWHAIENNTKTLAFENTQLKRDMANTQSQVTSLHQQMASTLKSQQRELARFQEALTNMHNSQADRSQDWLEDEARYFIRTARYKLQLEHNVPLALTLLRMADNSLKQSDGPNALALRQSISDSIATLSTIPVVDIDSLYFQLSALDKKINGLSIKKPITTTSENNAPTKNTWMDGLKYSMTKLKGLIVVRHHDSAPVTQLDDHAINQLYQNMHLHIASAQYALLQRQETIYQQSLIQVVEWINTYFDTSTPAAMSVLGSLQKLASVDINPKLPNIYIPAQASNPIQTPDISQNDKGTEDDTPTQPEDSHGAISL